MPPSTPPSEPSADVTRPGHVRLPSQVEDKLEGYKPDMAGPLVWQVTKMNKKDYLLWVHTPHKLPFVARFFASSFLEFFSRTPWYVVPAVWVPVALWLASGSWATNGPKMTVGLMAVGLLFWTLIEYTLHRWVFHVDERLPDNRWALFAHFLLHGVHHLIPMDRYRLVMPPPLIVPLIALTWTVLRTVFFWWSEPTFRAFYSGAMIGYICYDMMHYFTHHGIKLDRKSYCGRMRSYHMKHHFADMYHLGYGITSKVWDRVFGTVLPMPGDKKAA